MFRESRITRTTSKASPPESLEDRILSYSLASRMQDGKLVVAPGYFLYTVDGTMLPYTLKKDGTPDHDLEVEIC